MVNIARVRIVLSGFVGGPGVATHYVLDPATAMPELKGLWAGWAVQMPASVQVAYPAEGDYIDPATGILAGAWSIAGRAGDAGAALGAYSGPSGAICNWGTGVVFDGRRLRGKTFIVPLGNQAYQNDGTLDPAISGQLQTIAAQKVATLAGNLVIWHRPQPVGPGNPVATIGGTAFVTSATVPDKAAVLRSRRD